MMEAVTLKRWSQDYTAQIPENDLNTRRRENLNTHLSRKDYLWRTLSLNIWYFKKEPDVFCSLVHSAPAPVE
jgi:hypothetical protein